MADFRALLGVDLGTHSSKWLWKTIEDDGSFTEGRFKILRSDVRLKGNTIFLADDLPPEGSVFKSSLKRRIIEYPDGPFWEGKISNIQMSLGELVTYSLWYLVRESYDDLVDRIRDTPNQVDIRFSLPNWVNGRESAEARVRYEQAARVACYLFVSRKKKSSLAADRYDWRRLVERARDALEISDEISVDDSEQGFRNTLEKSFPVNDQVTFRFVAESSAAGLAGLRKSGEQPPAILRKILVVDVGAGSADIGYVIRSINYRRQESLSQLPPASTCHAAGDDLTKRIVAIFTEKGNPISLQEAEAIKVGGRTREWIKHPTVTDWTDSIALHAYDYVRNIPDESWLPKEPPLEVLITGGSGVVPGLREALALKVEEALRTRFSSASTTSIALDLPRPYNRDANRLAVALGAASEELPLLTYFRRLAKRLERPTVRMSPSWV